MKTIQSFALILFLPSALDAATLTNLWSFDGPAPFNDNVGTANGVGGASVTTTTGFNGGTAALFPASVGSAAQYVDIDESGITSMVGSGFSITFWFRIADDSATFTRGFFDFSGNGGDTGIQGLVLGNNNLNFRVDGAGTPFSVINTAPPSSVEDNQWHHIALTYQAGLADGFKLYLDGALLTSSSTTTFTQSTAVGPNANSYLGAFNFTGVTDNKGLNGALDEFGVWSGVLSPSEVTALASIPEPATALLGGLGLLTLLRRRR